MTGGSMFYLPLFGLTVLADAASLSICSRISRVTDLMGKIFGLHKTCIQHDTHGFVANMNVWRNKILQCGRVSTCMQTNLAQIPFFRIHKSSLGKNLEQVSRLFNRNRKMEWVWTEMKDKMRDPDRAIGALNPTTICIDVTHWCWCVAKGDALGEMASMHTGYTTRHFGHYYFVLEGTWQLIIDGIIKGHTFQSIEF